MGRGSVTTGSVAVFGLLSVIVIVCISAISTIIVPTQDYMIFIYSSGLIISVVMISGLVGGIVGKQKVLGELENIQASINNAELAIRNASTGAKTFNQKIDDSVGEIKRIFPSIESMSSVLANSVETLRYVIVDNIGHNLINSDDMKELEAAVPEKKEIWILTSALELEDNELADVIRENFRKGIVYRYFLPTEDSLLIRRFEEMARQWVRDSNLTEEDANRQIICHLVPSHFVYMTVVVLNPYCKFPTVLVKFPTSNTYPEQKYPLIYRVENDPPEAAKVFVSALQDLVEGKCAASKTCELDISPR